MVFLANAFPTGKTILGSLRSSSLIAMQFRYPFEQVEPKACISSSLIADILLCLNLGQSIGNHKIRLESMPFTQVAVDF